MERYNIRPGEYVLKALTSTVYGTCLLYNVAVPEFHTKGLKQACCLLPYASKAQNADFLFYIISPKAKPC